MLKNQEKEEALLRNSAWDLNWIQAINKQFPFFENYLELQIQEVPVE